MPSLIELTANTGQHRAWFPEYWLQPIAAVLAQPMGKGLVMLKSLTIIFLVQDLLEIQIVPEENGQLCVSKMAILDPVTMIP